MCRLMAPGPRIGYGRKRYEPAGRRRYTPRLAHLNEKPQEHGQQWLCRLCF
jgi:hypothetical protein